MRLARERDGEHQLPAATVFTEQESETSEALIPEPEGKTERRKNPHPIRGLARAGWVVARPGGWNCDDKPPGSITYNGAIPCNSSRTATSIKTGMKM